ncbi:amidase [Oscillatoria sp. CS-180]|uniref:amidase n=1 Tax=Oscillatoria sp. CS-180 TaxID=3021720 RepID=UPI00232F6D7A|nr:amidase [Oscillatoria sp. CS-180]MDB9526761.1 amidase [Oscillatoria sp. CS-180]
MNRIDLAFAPALEQARLIRNKTVSPLELTQLYLERIDRLNPILGSYFTVMTEAAIADAQAKTELLATTTETLPPFFGVPLSVKDLNPIAGVPCSYGIAAARNRIAERDDGLICRLREAGFVILGKTATSQLGSFPYTEPPGFLPTRNPWNLAHTPGGSSGGGASALAAGLCAIAQGSDGGGSVRGPAFCCGLVGLKPSRGRVSFAPVGERLEGLATNGPIGRTVADTAAFLDVMAGYVTGDPYWLPPPETSFWDVTQTDPPSLKVGVVTAVNPIGEADADCKQAVLDTAQRLEALGHAVESLPPPDLTELIEPFTIAWQCVLAEANVPFFVLEKMNRWLWWRAWRIRSGQYLRAISKLQVVSRRIVETFQDYDIILLPVYLNPAIRVGEWQSLRCGQILENIINWIAPCPPFNASGQPAIAIPTGFTSAGLPLGVQLVGQPAADDTVLALAAQLERANPWQHHRPKLAL